MKRLPAGGLFQWEVYWTPHMLHSKCSRKLPRRELPEKVNKAAGIYEYAFDSW